MNYFIIGDIHGCYHTFIQLLTHWKQEEEMLISVGDLIDKGNYSGLVIDKCMTLSASFENAIFLKGNHEIELISYLREQQNKKWFQQSGKKTLTNFKSNQLNISKISNWLDAMPSKFETENLLISHAGVSETDNPFDETNRNGIFWNRNPLKNLGKLQIHGHTPTKKNQPIYDVHSNSWNIDTGAYLGIGLSAVKLNYDGELLDHIFVKTHLEDIG